MQFFVRAARLVLNAGSVEGRYQNVTLASFKCHTKVTRAGIPLHRDSSDDDCHNHVSCHPDCFMHLCLVLHRNQVSDGAMSSTVQGTFCRPCCRVIALIYTLTRTTSNEALSLSDSQSPSFAVLSGDRGLRGHVHLGAPVDMFPPLSNEVSIHSTVVPYSVNGSSPRRLTSPPHSAKTDFMFGFRQVCRQVSSVQNL